MSKSFIEKLTTTIERHNSLLCVGLDPDITKISKLYQRPVDDLAELLLRWATDIINQTADLACCYKPNFAFYEQYGPIGLEILQKTIAAVPPEIPVLLDAKRGDIGHTAAAYAQAAFEVWGADAITISPYLGQDSVTPFLDFPGKMVFLLCYTSNPSARQIQEFGNSEERLFEYVLRCGQHWGEANQIAFVVGATQPAALAQVRSLAPDRWFLTPGVGAQGGDLNAAMAAGLNQRGRGLIVPVSRSIIYAADPRPVAQQLRDEINTARSSRPASPAESSVTPAQVELIMHLHEAGCIQFGDFTLASGKQSPIYIDLRRVSSHPRLLNQVAQAYAALLRPLNFDHLAAVPYAALPIGAAIALSLNKPLIFPRKEAKSYGTGQTVEGDFAAGDTAVVIEDLVTSGGSVLQAIDQLAAAEVVVHEVAVLIDRQQGGPENLTAQGYHLHAALRMADILTVLHQAGRISAEKVAQVKGLTIRD